MGRYETTADEADSTLQRARDTSTNRIVMLERNLRSERLRQIQAVPPHAAIAPFVRVREGNRLHLVHPEPLGLSPPIDEFDVAQAIGSMLDGLSWLHAHGVIHGAVDAAALTTGPTGGRLSLAGASSHDGRATPEEDVYAASALAFSLLVGDRASSDAHADKRLARCASPSVSDAVRAGLDPDTSRRPTAAFLASMVRGEFLPPVEQMDSPARLMARMRAALAASVAYAHHFADSSAKLLRPSGARARTSLGAAVAMLIVIGGFAAARQPGKPQTMAAASSPLGQSQTPPLVATDGESRSQPPRSLASTASEPATTTRAAAIDRDEAPVPVAVPVTESAAPTSEPPTTSVPVPPTTANPAPTTTVPAKPIPTTTVMPTVPTTSSSSSTSVTTRRASSTTTRPTKSKKANDIDLLDLIGDLLGLG